MLDFNVVYAFEDGESVPNAVDAHFLELIMLEHSEYFTHDAVF